MSSETFMDLVCLDVVLIGEFKCRLTVGESNAWAEFLHAHPDYAALLHGEVQFEVVRHRLAGAAAEAEDAQRLGNIVRERQQLLRGLFYVAKAWYAGVTAARDQKGE